MKKLIKVLFTMLMVLNLTSPVFALSNKDTNYTIIDNRYSVIQNESWKLKGKEGRVEELQFTSDELKNFTIDELVYAVIKYPFFLDITAYNSYIDGFNETYSSFTAVQELLRREGVIKSLTKYYQKLSHEKNISDSFNNISLQMQNIEVFAAMPIIQEKFNGIELNLLYSIIAKNATKIISIKNTDDYDVFGFINTLKESGYETKSNPDIALLDVVIMSTCSTQFGSCTYQTVYTPKGTSVSVIRHDNDFSASVKSSYNSYMGSLYPAAVLQSSATPYYNCHSFAWYSATTTNRYWMNSPTSYMTDGSYSSGGTVVAGMKINYSTGDHSGIVTGVTGYGVSVKSKWGAYGLYIHQWNDSPYGTSGVTFWKK